ncbi:MAG: T9SS type A sorting domain-containing protein [Bacteroidota bacterium]
MKKFTLLLISLVMTALISQAQVERSMVAVEIGTGTWCQYCPGAALGADDLVANGKRVAVIENHNGDTYVTTNSDARNSYYNITGFPTARFDGGNAVVGGSHTASMYSSYLPKYNICIANLSPLTIDYTVTRTGQQFVFDFTITKVSTLPNNQLVFQFTATQSEIQQAWQGQTQLNFVNRLMIPDASGTVLDFTSTDVQTVNIVANIDPMWPMQNMEFVAFVQDNATKAIQNTVRPVMSDFTASTATNICQNNTITFANSSVGRPAEVLWYFPGGSPATSTASDAPSILYQTPGTYNVTMVTKTGLKTDSIVKENYVTIRPGANTTTPAGLTLVCTNNANQTTDYTTASANATTYIWDLYPAAAGTLTNNGASCTIHWVNNWNGTASLRVRGSNDCGLGPWTEYMDMVCTSCLGVNETDQSQPVTVYPNPASKNINVSVNTITNEVLKLKFMNALGTVVYAETIDNSGKLTRSINVEGLADGIYFLKLEGKKLNYSQKVTVQH